MTISVPNIPFSGFRASVFTAIAASVGRFVDVPAPVGRGSDPVKAAKKINLRLEEMGSPFEVRLMGSRKDPKGIGLFAIGSIGEGRAPRDSASGRKRTAANEGVETFGKERIAPTRARWAEKRETVAEARARLGDEAKAAFPAQVAEKAAATVPAAAEPAKAASFTRSGVRPRVAGKK